jgi:hypothetical protein
MMAAAAASVAMEANFTISFFIVISLSVGFQQDSGLQAPKHLRFACRGQLPDPGARDGAARVDQHERRSGADTELLQRDVPHVGHGDADVPQIFLRRGGLVR